jgi:hypothetical protein
MSKIKASELEFDIKMPNFACLLIVCVLLPMHCSVYEGDVVNGMRHGVGVLLCPKRNITYNGEWMEGKQSGKVQIFRKFLSHCLYYLLSMHDC